MDSASGAVPLEADSGASGELPLAVPLELPPAAVQSGAASSAASAQMQIPPNKFSTRENSDGMVWCGTGKHMQPQTDCTSWVKKKQGPGDQESVVIGVYYKCKKCNIRCKRQNEVLQGLSPGEKVAWDNMTKTARAQFWQDHQDCLAKDLDTALRSHVSEANHVFVGVSKLSSGNLIREVCCRKFSHRKTMSKVGCRKFGTDSFKKYILKGLVCCWKFVRDGLRKKV